MENEVEDIITVPKNKGELTLDRLFKIVSTICGVLLVWFASDIRSDVKDMKAGYADLNTRLRLVEYVLKMDQKVDKLSTDTKGKSGGGNTAPYFANVLVSKPEDEYTIKNHN